MNIKTSPSSELLHSASTQIIWEEAKDGELSVPTLNLPHEGYGLLTELESYKTPEYIKFDDKSARFCVVSDEFEALIREKGHYKQHPSSLLSVIGSADSVGLERHR